MVEERAWAASSCDDSAVSTDSRFFSRRLTGRLVEEGFRRLRTFGEGEAEAVKAEMCEHLFALRKTADEIHDGIIRQIVVKDIVDVVAYMKKKP